MQTPQQAELAGIIILDCLDFLERGFKIKVFKSGFKSLLEVNLLKLRSLSSDFPFLITQKLHIFIFGVEKKIFTCSKTPSCKKSSIFTLWDFRTGRPTSQSVSYQHRLKLHNVALTERRIRKKAVFIRRTWKTCI